MNFVVCDARTLIVEEQGVLENTNYTPVLTINSREKPSLALNCDGGVRIIVYTRYVALTLCLENFMRVYTSYLHCKCEEVLRQNVYNKGTIVVAGVHDLWRRRAKECSVPKQHERKGASPGGNAVNQRHLAVLTTIASSGEP